MELLHLCFCLKLSLQCIVCLLLQTCLLKGLLVTLLYLRNLSSELILRCTSLSKWWLESEVPLGIMRLSWLLDAGEFTSQVTQSSWADPALETHQLRLFCWLGVLSLQVRLLARLILISLSEKLVLSDFRQSLDPRSTWVRHHASLESWLHPKWHLIDLLSLIRLLSWSMPFFLIRLFLPKILDSCLIH